MVALRNAPAVLSWGEPAVAQAKAAARVAKTAWGLPVDSPAPGQPPGLMDPRGVARVLEPQRISKGQPGVGLVDQPIGTTPGGKAPDVTIRPDDDEVSSLSGNTRERSVDDPDRQSAPEDNEGLAFSFLNPLWLDDVPPMKV